MINDNEIKKFLISKKFKVIVEYLPNSDFEKLFSNCTLLLKIFIYVDKNNYQIPEWIHRKLVGDNFDGGIPEQLEFHNTTWTYIQ